MKYLKLQSRKIKIYSNYRVLLPIIFIASCTAIVDDHSKDPLSFLVPTPPKPEVKEAYLDPQYFCSGETLYLTWKTKNIDKIELLDKDNNTLFETTLASGTASTPPIHRDMLKLKVKGYARDKHKTYIVHDLWNIDEAHWTEKIPSTKELFIPNSRRLEYIGEEEVINSEGETVRIPIYKIFFTYTGFSWNLYELNFSQRAKMEGIENCTDEEMRFSISHSGEEIQLVSNQQADFQNLVSPVGVSAYYLEPKEEFYGYQIDDITKPETEFLHIDQIRQPKSAKMRLRVICEENL